MDVGQVTFTVQANNLDTVLQQALKLETIMNGLDGKTFGKWNKEAAKAQAANDKHAYMTAKTQSEQAKKELTDARKQALINNVERKRQRDADKQKEIDQRNYNKAVQRSLRNHKALIKQTEKEAAARQKEAEAIANAPKVFQQQMENNLVNFGARMQTLGATVERMTTPFTNVLTGFTRMAGAMAYSKVFQSIQGMFSRYDTMQTYEKVLNNIGLDATKKFAVGTNKANTAIKNLEQSVLGLPTGLDEIVASMKVYAGITGDVEKATKVAIAANNAFIAGGMDETRTRMAERQLQNILSNGELTAMQWNSLQKNMPMAFNAVARELGYAQKDAGKLLADLKAGTVEANDFIDAFIKVGTEGKIYKAAQVMKQTWSSISQNITNAFNRMGEGILKSLDTVFMGTDGRTFLQHVLGVDKNGNDVGGGIKHMIDGISESAQKWIKANPEKITSFFKTLSEIDIKGIASGYAQFGRVMLRLYAGMAKLFGWNNGFLIKAMLGANIAGKGARILGGLTKGLAGPISKLMTLFTFGASAKMTSAIAGATKIANHGKVLVSASKTVQGVALTWQGVANKALNIISIGMIAASIKLLADAFVAIGKANVNVGDFEGFAAGAALLIGEFAGLAQLLGAKGLVTGAMQVSRIFGEIEIGAIAGDVILIAKALNEVSKVEIPDQGKINRVLSSITSFAESLPPMDLFTSIGKFFSGKAVQSAAKAVTSVTEAITSVNKMKGSLKQFAKAMFGSDAAGGKGGGGGSWGSDPNSIIGIMNMMLEQFDNNKLLDTLVEGWKSSNIASIFSSVASMMQDFTTIATTKVKPKQIDKAKENIEALSKAIKPLLDAFNAMYSLEFGTTSGMGRTQAEQKGARSANKSISSTYGAQAQGFAKMMEQLSSTLDYVSQIVSKLNGMKSELKSLKNNYGEDFDLTPLSNVMSSVSKAFEEAGVSTGNYSLAPTNMDYIDKAMKSLGKIIKKMINIKALLMALEGSEGDFTQIGAILGNMVSDLIAACSNAPELQQYIDTLQETVDSIQTLVDSIPDKYKKKTKVEIDGTVDNDVPPEIAKAKRAIMASIASLPSVLTKTISIHLRGQASAVGVTGLNTALDVLRKQHGGLVYRAGGGSLRRGTDAIPAVLTKGEWVMNRHATSVLGGDILNKLNHLDIRGALNSLSLKAGQVQSRTVNNNSTKNANVTVNNYHSDGIGYGRASRIVRAL